MTAPPYQRILDPEDARPALEVATCPPEEVIARPFDLAKDIPLRVAVFPEGEDEHLLLAVFHHIAFDEWSFGPFARDVAEAYTARLDGAPPGWEPPPVQYADHALWQRELLGDPLDPGSVHARQLDHWAKALAGLPEEIPLPVDRPRPGTVGQRGGTLTADLPPSLARGLGRLARDANASMFMVCQAAVAALLHRTGAGDDIPLGSPVAGRTEDAARDLVGFFVNTLVLRADVSGDPTFAELLARVREADLAGLANQDLPFEAVVEALRPRRVPGRNPLFQVMVGYENQGVGDVRFPGLEQREARFGPGAAKFDLDFIFREVPDGLGLIVDYSADLFDRDTAAALADGVIALLAAVADDPGTKVAALPAELTARTVTAQPGRHRVRHRLRHRVRHRLRGPGRRPGGGAVPDLRRGAGRPRGRPGRRLLRPRRPLAARDAARPAHPAGTRLRGPEDRDPDGGADRGGPARPAGVRGLIPAHPLRG
ncbi:condensation domain-containing protein [Actinomadura madurae]|uniref:condensation domain-containing protein n=1 Tax=Actinomadura madurae TaxID=1993 RepID=UPI003FD89B19